jgi:hypothetical protein
VSTQNAGIQPEMEFKVTKLSTSCAGLTDILIESEKVCVLLKLKNIPLKHMVLKSRKTFERAQELNEKSLCEILQRSFFIREKCYMKYTIGEFVEMIHPKIDDNIEDYKLKQTVQHKDFRAYSVIFI